MIPDRTYTADSICPTPDIDVPDSLKPFVKDTDYKVYCYDNVNADEATLVVEGIGNYADTIKTIFIINPQSSRFPPQSKTWCITAKFRRLRPLAKPKTERSFTSWQVNKLIPNHYRPQRTLAPIPSTLWCRGTKTKIALKLKRLPRQLKKLRNHRAPAS